MLSGHRTIGALTVEQLMQGRYSVLDQASLAAWLIAKPLENREGPEMFLVRMESDRIETTARPLVAKRFATAAAARSFANQYHGLLDDWRVVLR